VENCFKHGTSNMLEQPWVNLQIHLKEDTMYMKLMNGKAKQETGTLQRNSFGIGIENVRKRLELLYPDKHVFSITDIEEVFVVDLTLQLERINTPRKKEGNIFVLTQHD
jgi:LytS/YehU family sensor histidine kinase